MFMSRGSADLEQLAEQIQTTQKLIRNPETDWTERSLVITKLAEAIEALGKEAGGYSDAVQLLLGLSSELGALLEASGQRLIMDVCENLRRIVEVMGRDFGAMANALLPQIINLSRNTLPATRQLGAELLQKLSELVRYDLTLLKTIFMRSNQDRPRVLILKQLQKILVYWSEDEVLPWKEDVLETVQHGLSDQHENVREVARETLVQLSSRWSDQVDVVVETLSKQTKMLLLRRHQGTPLATAIERKHPDLAAIPVTHSRKRALLRSGARKFSSNKRHKET
ncbi:unnamed protein product [Hyaloperonospora brassicae]|uniref:CLASP N-terminal domain-containing protein n=1 Tax=Hyaloperonospora brassicae TaxID=162125 RepID=A0AAV0UBE0_HYABA|nr:unnamed protein product [Hyaloperonospora brassicae]